MVFSICNFEQPRNPTSATAQAALKGSPTGARSVTGDIRKSIPGQSPARMDFS
jgi:hypothetical protein